jgi:hypothetical protein
MEGIVICKKCSRLIEKRDELITSTYLFEVVPYHEECFAKDIKGAKSLLVSNQPLNGFSGNIWTIFSIITALVLLIFAGEQKFLSVFVILPAIYRLYSYFTFERLLDK